MSLVTSSGMCAEAYKRPHATPLGVHSWFISQWVRRYMYTHRLMCWHTRVARAYFLQTYLIGLLSLFRKRLPDGHANTLRELPGNTMFNLTSTVSTGPSCLLVGAHVHCLLSCQVYISRSVLSSGETIHPTLCTSQLLASLGGCQLNMTWVAQTMDFIPPWLWPESSSVVMGKKESSNTLSYQEG